MEKNNAKMGKAQSYIYQKLAKLTMKTAQQGASTDWPWCIGTSYQPSHPGKAIQQTGKEQ